MKIDEVINFLDSCSESDWDAVSSRLDGSFMYTLDEAQRFEEQSKLLRGLASEEVLDFAGDLINYLAECNSNSIESVVVLREILSNIGRVDIKLYMLNLLIVEIWSELGGDEVQVEIPDGLWVKYFNGEHVNAYWGHIFLSIFGVFSARSLFDEAQASVSLLGRCTLSVMKYGYGVDLSICDSDLLFKNPRDVICIINEMEL